MLHSIPLGHSLWAQEDSYRQAVQRDRTQHAHGQPPRLCVVYAIVYAHGFLMFFCMCATVFQKTLKNKKKAKTQKSKKQLGGALIYVIDSDSEAYAHNVMDP